MISGSIRHLGGVVALAAVGVAFQAPEAPAVPAVVSYVPAYRATAAAAPLLDALAAAAPASTRRFELGRSIDGRAVAALEIAAPGPLAPALRPTLLLVGGLDGRSLAGSEAVLAAAHALVEHVATLSPDLTVIAIPFASPEGLDAAVLQGWSSGVDALPVDDDRDGRVDEDGPDDLDEDGAVLQMLIEDRNGPWARASDPRFLVPAGPDDALRYVLAPEGRDDDGDGRFNEDGQGGVALDRNFPLHRDGAWRDPRCGALPLSEPLSRALADFALSRRTLAVLLFQGRHGGLAIAGGTPELDDWTRADRALYERCAQTFRTATGRASANLAPLRDACGAPQPGAALDWFAAVRGALGLEVAAWGPAVEASGDVAVRDARYDGGIAPLTRSSPCALDRAWATWLDNARAGMGFAEWRPIELAQGELGSGRRALVGGWEPWTIENPPPASLAKALRGVPEFVRELCASVPKLEISARATRDGGVAFIDAEVRNIGRLPTSLAAWSAVRGNEEVVLELVAPEGARLLAGAAREALPRLLGSESSRTVKWMVAAPAGTKLTLRARAAWCADVTLEVAP